MQCEEIKSLLGSYVNGKLESSLNLQVSRHLDACHFCKEELDFDEGISRTLQSEAGMPHLSAHFNQMVLSIASSSKETIWHRLNSYSLDHPWTVSVLGMTFSLLLLFIYPFTNSFKSLTDVFLAFFSFKPLIVALIIAMSFWIFYANESFLDKLIYSPEDRNGNGSAKPKV